MRQPHLPLLIPRLLAFFPPHPSSARLHGHSTERLPPCTQTWADILTCYAVAAPAHVNILMRFLAACCSWPVLGQGRGALR